MDAIIEEYGFRDEFAHVDGWKTTLKKLALARTAMIESKYTIGGIVSRGAYGKVMYALVKKTNEQQVVKEIDTSFDNGAELGSQTIRELAILKGLEQPGSANVVQIHDVLVNKYLRIKPNIQFFMPKLKDLKSVSWTHYSIERKATLVRSLFRQIMQGLAYIHRKQIVHLDLKPQNILVDDSSSTWVCKLADFGLARYWSDSKWNRDPVQDVEELVTLWFRAPELLLGGSGPLSPISSEVDVWSAACILFDMQTDDVLFPGQTQVDMVRRIFNRFGEAPPNSYLTTLSDYPLAIRILHRIKDLAQRSYFDDDDDENDETIELDMDRIQDLLARLTSDSWWESKFGTRHFKSRLQSSNSFLDELKTRPYDPSPTASLVEDDRFLPDQYDLFMQMCRYDPRERISAADALSHPYLAEPFVVES